MISERMSLKPEKKILRNFSIIQYNNDDDDDEDDNGFFSLFICREK